MPSRSLWKYARCVSGAKRGAVIVGSLALCSHSVNSRRVDRSIIRMVGEPALRDAPMNTVAGGLNPNCAYWLVFATSESPLLSGTHSRMAMS